MLKQSIKWIILTFLTGSVLVALFLLLISHTVNSSTPKIASVPASLPVSTQTESVPVYVPLPSSTIVPVPSSAPFSPTGRVEPASTDQTDPIASLLQEMTTQQKVGQLVMFGFDGKDRPTHEYTALFQKYHVGNALLLTNNIEKSESDGGFKRASRMISAFQDSASSYLPTDMLFSVDVEGGKVTRFRWNPVLASAAELGHSNAPETAYEQSRRIGQALSDAGIMMNLSPVLDISTNPGSTYLGTRIISADTRVTSSIGSSIIQGLHSGRCLSTAKHFPGHGATISNSHNVCPVVHKTLPELQSYDLIPFYQAINCDVDAIMIAHISYPEIDPDHISTTSPVIIQELLRNEMGFEGIVISDDFRMKALASSCSTAEAATGFILAGGDIILCGPDIQTQTAIMDALLSAVSTGIITEERLNESVTRILKAKLFSPATN